MKEEDNTIDADATELEPPNRVTSTPGKPAEGPEYNSEIYKATYSGVTVFEKVINGVTVMRRKSDSAFNATQLLKVAGLDKAKRTKMLEKEIHTGAHEKVQGGYGKFQGTWVPYDRAVALAQKLLVYDDIKPLFLFNPSHSGEDTPTKEQMLARASRNNSTISNSNASQYNPMGVSSMSRQPSALGRTFSTMTDNDNEDEDDDGEMKSHKRSRVELIKGPRVELDTQEYHEPEFRTYTHDLEVDNPNAPFTLDPLTSESSEAEEHAKGIVTQIFLSAETTSLLDAVGGDEEALKNVNLDVPIDELGHTALHWAAALARTPLVDELVSRGANRIRGNKSGESPLVRAVLVTNNHDQETFSELLNVLYPCIPVLDHQRRSVLHHIALTAGIKRRSQASRYYLETLLEWIVKTGSYLKKGAITLGRFMSEIVNAQDKNGDTCLNIAARIGNKAIVQQLLDVGADPSIPNRAGLRPIDFGINVNGLVANASANNGQRASAMTVPTAPGTVNNTQLGQSSQKILDSMQQVLLRLDADFKVEISAKQKTIDSLHAELRDATLKLSESRKNLDILKQSETKLGELKQRITNLDRATQEEEQRFMDQTTELGSIGNYDVDFDADEPFRIYPVYDQIEQQLEQNPDIPLDQLTVNSQVINPQDLPPAAVLRARIRAYRENEVYLQGIMDSLKEGSQQLEKKFRRVVALCTGVDEERIDSMLDGLVQAVESDPDEVDMGRVVGFLKKIDDKAGA